MKLTDIGRDYKLLNITDDNCCPRNFKDHCPATLRDTDLIIVGEAPGETEVEKQEGFTGRSGRLLRSMLHRKGITSYSLSNVVKCRPPNNRTPKNSIIRCCMNRTAEEVRGYPVVALIGSTAMKAFFPGKRASNLRGNAVVHPDYPGQRFYGMYHPAWALRKGDEGKNKFAKQAGRLARILRGEGPDMNITQPGHENYFDKLDEALATGKISFDIETSHLESWKATSRIISIALTADGRNAVFCHEDDPAFIGTMAKLRDFLSDPSNHVIGHHIGFDLDWMEQKEDFVARAKGLDTGVLWHYAEGYKMPSLKKLVAEELDGYRHMVVDPHKVDDREKLVKYNVEDVIYPWKLFHEGIRHLDTDQRELYLTVGSPSDHYLQRITSNGIWFNTENYKKVKEELWEEWNENLRKWDEKDPDIDVYEGDDGHLTADVLEGTKALRTYLFETKGLPIIRRTKKSDQPKTDKSTLQELRDDYGADQLRYLLECRKIEKLLSTFVEGYADEVEADGRIHPGFLNTRTDSGRWSSTNPNLQNCPRDKRIRNQFGAPPPNRLLVEADLSQIEMRVVLSLCEDWDAIEAYHEGMDAHDLTAQTIAGGEDFTKDQRTNAKVINFGNLYGGTEYTLQRQAKDWGLDWSDQETARHYNAFFRTFPKVETWHEEVIQRLRDNRGVIKDAMGFVHRYPKWNHPEDSVREHWERSAINAMGQGPASFIMSRIGILAQREFRKKGLHPRIKMVNTVHDSVIMEADEDDIQVICEVLTNATKKTKPLIDDWFHTPLVLDFEHGQTWGDKQEMEYKAVA